MSYYLPFDPSIKLGQQFGWNPGLGPNPAGGHNGDDWLTPVGTLVRAAGNGVVVFAGEFDSTYEDNWGWNLHYGGKMVVLNMDGDTAPYFEYGHNSQLLVKTGDRVVAGRGIAITGNTDGGTKVSTGPHCHVGALPWNFNLGSNTYGRVNPRLFMTKHWDGGTINLASTSSITPITTPTPSEEDEVSAAEVFSKKLTLKNGAESTFETQVVNISDDLSKVLTRLEEDRSYAQKVNLKIDALFNLLTSLPSEILDKPITTTNGKETTLATELKWMPANFAAANDNKDA